MQRVTTMRLSYKYLLGIALAGVLISNCGGDDPEPDPNSGGTPNPPEEQKTAQASSGTLPAWQEGYLDIHFINTVSGESAFIIMPDGTQMLVDAASSLAETGKDELTQRWKPNQRGSEIISTYIKACMNWTGNNTIDALLGTHFHNDHMGGYSTSLPLSKNSNTYRINGVTEIMDNFPVTKLVDRGYPNYNYPYDLKNASLEKNRAEIVNNYRYALQWHQANRGLEVEKFVPGSNTQFKLTRNPGKYTNVKVQNIYANGTLWTGTGNTTKEIFPEASKFSGTGANEEYCPSENACSTVFTLTYGLFNFYSGADICNSGNSNYEWKGVENSVTEVVSAVEVMKADHHGVKGSGAQMLLTKLKPQVIICTPWQDGHPETGVHGRFANSSTNNGEAKIFYTNLAPSNKATFTSGLNNIFATSGHVVVRVDPEGKSYHTYLINDQNYNFQILKTTGKIFCR